MGNPAYGQRTPTLGLKVESDETRNFNWHKLDDTVARAFTPDSPLQIPPDSITVDHLFPGTAIRQWSDASSPVQVPLLLATPRTVLTIHLSGLRDAPILLTGYCLLSWENTTATPTDSSLQVTAQRRGSEGRTHTAPTKIPATAKLPVYLPIALLHVPGAADLGVETADFDLVLTKLSGADATIRIIPEDGRIQAIELA